MTPVYFPAWSLVKRELMTTLRGPRAFFLLVLFVSIGAAYIALSWPESTSDFASAGISSRVIMQTFTLLMFGGCALFVPAFAAGAIVLERERSTYDFLRMTLVRPSGIVVAKLLNALGFFALLLVALAPIISVAFFLVGVDTAELVRAIAVIAATALSCASAGLLSSALFRRSAVAIGVSYLGVLALMLGPLIGAYMVAAAMYAFVSVRSIEGFIEPVAEIASPVFTLFYVLNASSFDRVLAWSLLYQGLFVAVCLSLTMLIVRRPLKPAKIEHRKPIEDEEVLAQRRKGFPYYIIDPLRRKKPIEDGRNPMMAREMRWGLFNRGSVLIRIFYCSFIVYFFAGALASIDGRNYTTMGRWLLIQIIMTVVATPALMANTMTKERELRNLDMLRMTLLRPKDLIVGKLFAGVGSASPVVFAAILSCIPVIALGARNWGMLAMGYGTLLVCTFVSLSLGLLASLITQRTSAALVVSYVFNLVVFTGASLVAVVGIESLARTFVGTFPSPEWAETLRASAFSLSPIWTFVYSAIWDSSRSAELNYTFWSAGMAAWTLFGVATVALSVGIFRRYKMRDA